MLSRKNWTLFVALIGIYTPFGACLSDPDIPMIVDDSPQKIAYTDEILEIVKDWRKSLKLHQVDEDSIEGVEIQDDEDIDVNSN